MAVERGFLANRDFLHPVAIDENGHEVFPDEAVRGRIYFCPNQVCRAQLHLREGPIRRPHFAHPPGASCDGRRYVGGESEVHKNAKEIIVHVVNYGVKHPDKAPIIELPCTTCGRKAKEIRLPQAVSRAVPEYRLDNEFRCDVMLLDRRGNPFIAIEITCSHPLTKEKAQALRDRNLHVAELRGRDILRSNRRWKLMPDTSLERHCAACIPEIEAESERRVAEEYRVQAYLGVSDFDLPPEVSTEPCKCPRCGKEIIIFRWGSDAGIVNYLPPPHPLRDSPAIKEIQFATQRSYWVNRCLKCGHQFHERY